MSIRTVPFNYGLFYGAMVNLVGREPEHRVRHGLDGQYWFRYTPKHDADKLRLAQAAATLQEWLVLFELIPFRSRCVYGRLAHPQAAEEGKDYLDIAICHPAEQKPAR